MSALNCTNPKIQRLSTVSSVVAAAGHVFSTRWDWYWQDENSKWQSYDTPSDGHAASTTSSQCLEREYMAGKKTILHPSPLVELNRLKSSQLTACIPADRCIPSPISDDREIFLNNSL